MISNVNILVLKTRSLLGVTSTLEMEPTPSPRWDTGISRNSFLSWSLSMVCWTQIYDKFRRSHGGTDMKVTSSVLARSLEFVAQSGPAWDPLPPFRWADQGAHFLSRIIRTS